MTNIDRVSAALGEWGFNIVKAVLPQINIPVGGKLAGLMQIMGANPATYSIWNELGFLAEPIVQTVVTPAVHKMLGGIPDEQVPELANKFIDSFIARAEEKGSVNLFGLEIGKPSFERLKEILNSKIES
jgi:hypothetical protein